MNYEYGIMNYEKENTKKNIHSFTDLNTWKEGHKLVVLIYQSSREFPKEEQFGLTNQIRRAAVSITSNIAEGFSRHSFKEKVQFYSIALGSLTEAQNQLMIGRDIGYLSKDAYEKLAAQTIIVSKLCNGLIKKSRSILNS